ncbi:hypothetical protein PISMIDRAFT_683976, partial [Pisolithus microcarpus 441]
MYFLALLVAARLGAEGRATTASLMAISSSPSSSLTAFFLDGGFLAGGGLLPDGFRTAGFWTTSGGEDFLSKKSVT